LSHRELDVVSLPDLTGSAYTSSMRAIRAKVFNGRIVVDEPTTLPDGTILDLVLNDEGDELSPEERRALDAAISKAWDATKAGRVRSASDVITDLRKR
jgi:hypothetical protein